MNRLTLLLIIIIMLLPPHADALEIQARASQMLYNNSELKANPGEELETLELRLIHKDFFAYGSVDPLRMWGQDIEMYSFGVGYQQPIVGDFILYLKVGYDIPQYDSGGFPWEPVWFYQCQYLAPTYGPARFHHYTAEIDSAFTGELGIDYKHRIYKNLSLGFSGAWRVAKHMVSAYGLEEDGIAGKTGWQVIENWDFGGYRLGVLVEWSF